MAKQGVNSLMCAYRASNGVYLLVFTTVSVGLHAHQHPVNQDSRVLLVQGFQKSTLIQDQEKLLNILVF